jgi:hypothetical protein
MNIRDWQLAPLSGTPDAARISVKVSYQRDLHGTEPLWFEFPARYTPYICRRGDPWLMALLPLAVARQEALSLEPLPVDAKLLENARRIMEIWHQWYPALKPIAIRCRAQDAQFPETGRKSGAFFSGGVDSYFTLLHNREFGDGRIDELIFIHGADAPLKQDGDYLAVPTSIQRAATAWQIPVLQIATNLRQTRYRQVNWSKLGNGPLLGAAGLLFQDYFERIFISSTWAMPDLHPLGSHPGIDPLYSSSRTLFVHYGAWADRLDKTKYISQVPSVLQNLHVCWESDTGENCGRCLKCLRTMIALELCGRLANCTAFRSNDIDFSLLRRQYIEREKEYFLPMIRSARAQGREDIAQAIEDALARTARINRLLLFGLIPKLRNRYLMHPALRQLSSGVLPWLRRLGNWINRQLP